MREMSFKRTKRQNYYRTDYYPSKTSFTTRDDYTYTSDKYASDKYLDDGYKKDDYYGKEEIGSNEIYSRDGGYGHSGGYGGGGGHHMSYGGHYKDLYSILAFSAFVLAVGYLVWYCLPDPARCDGDSATMGRRKRSKGSENLSDVAQEMDFILGLIGRAENIWKSDML